MATYSSREDLLVTSFFQLQNLQKEYDLLLHDVEVRYEAARDYEFTSIGMLLPVRKLVTVSLEFVGHEKQRKEVKS